jgi:hypothetical protein
MADDKRCNGWTNYETWAVALWIDNEQGSYGYWREQARENYRTAVDRGTGRDRAEEAATSLAQQLKEEIEEGNPLADKPSLYSDLLGAAISETNWYEIAKNWIDEVAPDIERGEEQPQDGE